MNGMRGDGMRGDGMVMVTVRCAVGRAVGRERWRRRWREAERWRAVRGDGGEEIRLITEVGELAGDGRARRRWASSPEVGEIAGDGRDPARGDVWRAGRAVWDSMAVCEISNVWMCAAGCGCYVATCVDAVVYNAVPMSMSCEGVFTLIVTLSLWSMRCSRA